MQKIISEGQLKVSEMFLIRLKLNKEPAYQIAQRAKVDPTVLSRLIHGAQPLRHKDQRILRVARVLGLSPDEAFESGEAAHAERPGG